jgi:hypothetical protein
LFNFFVTIHDNIFQVTTVAMILMCDSLLKEIENTVNLSLEMKLFLTERKQKRLLRQFSDFLLNNVPNISAARFFIITKSTILTLLGTVVSSFIIMVQFETNN